MRPPSAAQSRHQGQQASHPKTRTTRRKAIAESSRRDTVLKVRSARAVPASLPLAGLFVSGFAPVEQDESYAHLRVFFDLFDVREPITGNSAELISPQDSRLFAPLDRFNRHPPPLGQFGACRPMFWRLRRQMRLVCSHERRTPLPLISAQAGKSSRRIPPSLLP